MTQQPRRPNCVKLCLMLAVFLTSASVLANEPQQLSISYIKQKVAPVATLSTLVRLPPDSGLAGAKLAIADSNTTGKFVAQQLRLTASQLTLVSELVSKLDTEYQQGQRLFVLNLSAQWLLKAQLWSQDKDVILFNVGSQHDQLRQHQCHAKVFHTLPSFAMKNDALAQWLLARRLTKVLVIAGRQPQDSLLVNSFTRSAKRYGIKIIDQKQWAFNADLRRSASREMPLFTQTSRNYDVVFVADQIKDFAEYLPYNTYLPRPVIGSAGLEALAWHPRIEQWGATQLQHRFHASANRAMNEIDFAGYLAIRSLAAAFLNQKSSNPNLLRAYLRSPEFSLAAYLGRKLTFRTWNQQLRMPIALVQPHALVSQSPQQGVLHPINELDTLGFDAKQSLCQLKSNL